MFPLHQLGIDAVKGGSIPFPNRKPTGRDIIHHGNPGSIIVLIPVRCKILDAGRQNFYFHAGFLKMSGNFPQFHFCTAGNAFAVPRNDKCNFIHIGMLLSRKIINENCFFCRCKQHLLLFLSGNHPNNSISIHLLGNLGEALLLQNGCNILLLSFSDFIHQPA